MYLRSTNKNIESTNKNIESTNKNLELLVIKTNNGFEHVNKNIESTNKNLELLRIETNNNFKDLDIKYKLISEGLFAVVDEIKETNRSFEKRIEKTEKNIEELLKILVEKK